MTTNMILNGMTSGGGKDKCLFPLSVGQTLESCL